MRHPYLVPTSQVSHLPVERYKEPGACGPLSFLSLSQQPSSSSFAIVYLCNSSPSYCRSGQQWPAGAHAGTPCPTVGAQGPSHSPPFWENKVKELKYLGDDGKGDRDGPAQTKTWALTS